jgi:hypothetical protein
MAHKKRALKIVCGGQSGVDRAALDAAFDAGIARGGWCPRGKMAEDGPIPELYPLLETPSQDPVQRTKWNVRDSDATLILYAFKIFGGTEKTIEFAHAEQKPLLLVDLQKRPDYRETTKWIRSSATVILNVAGPRESEAPGIYTMAKEFLSLCFADL